MVFAKRECMAPEEPVVAPPKPVGTWIRVSTKDQAGGESPEHHERRARMDKIYRAYIGDEISVGGFGDRNQEEAHRAYLDKCRSLERLL